MNELIAVFDALLRRAVGETITIRLDLDPRLGLANLDQAQFQSALLNLVVNARDAMNGKGGLLTIETRNVELDVRRTAALGEIAPGPYVMVAVHDTGFGMTDEVKAKAIDPFYTTKDVGKGTGLGLSQVYGFARQSQGQIDIESQVGRGTTVRLYLPRVPATAVEDAATAGHADAGRTAGTVLVVEDDPDVLDIAVETLRTFGYKVLSAANAVEALSILERDTPIDVLFTDIVMPRGMNGVELAQEARKRRPGLRVLLASGYAREVLTGQGAVIAEMSFIAKPYQLAELSEALRAMIHAE
jgi:CheY-like chemotaxis protein